MQIERQLWRWGWGWSLGGTDQSRVMIIVRLITAVPGTPCGAAIMKVMLEILMVPVFCIVLVMKIVEMVVMAVVVLDAVVLAMLVILMLVMRIGCGS